MSAVPNLSTLDRMRMKGKTNDIEFCQRMKLNFKQRSGNTLNTFRNIQ